MVKLTLMKTAEYETPAGGMNRQYAEALLTRKISPSILPEAKNEVMQKLQSKLDGITAIFCSPELRTVQTAMLVNEMLLPDCGVMIDENLMEICFSIKEIPKEEYSSTEVRKIFIEKFSNDTLLESRKELEVRIKKALQNAAKHEKTLLVTHTFLMKTVQLSVESNIFSSPESMVYTADSGKRFFDYCETLEIETNNI